MCEQQLDEKMKVKRGIHVLIWWDPADILDPRHQVDACEVFVDVEFI